ncbi:MAG: HAD family hydrolase [Clostridia bacterium]|nr:HAD family hydrolase [Clostridia bacterium]
MSIKFILFDLDGTLLPMDQNKFAKAYFGSLAKKLAPYGYEPTEFIDAIWKGSYAMVKNDGSQTNEKVFWDAFVKIFGEKVLTHYPIFEDFYINDFNKVQPSCGYNPDTPPTVYKLKEMGYRVVLATNPLFPSMATECRIRWAGLEPSDFELYTTYENSCHCKPNLDYYRDILEKIGAKPEECLMVGNDVSEDMIAEELGMKVYLVTDCLLNKGNKDISIYPHGDIKGLIDYIKSL